MNNRSKYLITLIIIIIILGIIIPKISNNSHKDIPEGIWYEIVGLVDNPIESIVVLGFESVDDESEEYSYHIKVKTIFGFTYADIYVTDNGSYIERRLFN